MTESARIISAAAMSSLLPALALQEVLKNWVGSNGGSDLYYVAETWHKGELPKLAGMHKAADIFTLEEAMQSPEVKMVYITADADLTGELVKKSMTRNHSLTKPVFMEVA